MTSAHEYKVLEKLMGADHLIVITTKTSADSTVWRRYLQAHWSKLVWSKSRIVALAGVHGKTTGDIGSLAPGFVKQIKKQADKLKRNKAKDIEELDVAIDVVDVGCHLDREILDEDALVDEIIERDPTVIILTFCYTDVSVLNDILARAGVMSALFLDTGRTKITPLVKCPNGYIS